MNQKRDCDASKGGADLPLVCRYSHSSQLLHCVQYRLLCLAEQLVGNEQTVVVLLGLEMGLQQLEVRLLGFADGLI